MRTIVPALARSILCVSLAFGGLTSPLLAAPLNGLAAVVNGKVVTRSDVQNEVMAQSQALFRQYGNDPTALKGKLEELKGDALDALIENELILSEFESAGGAIKAEFIDEKINTIIRKSYDGDRQAFLKALSQFGMTLKEFRAMEEKKLVANYMRSQQGAKVEPPTYTEIERFYNENLSEFRENDYVKLRTLTIPKFSGLEDVTPEAQRSLAEDLRGQLVSGADFSNLAKTHSTDGAASSGGDRGWIDRSAISKQMADIAFATAEGAVSEIVESPGAYTLLWVEARKAGQVTPLEEIRDSVEARVKAEKGREVEKKWLDRLRRNAVIKRYP